MTVPQLAAAPNTALADVFLDYLCGFYFTDGEAIDKIERDYTTFIRSMFSVGGPARRMVISAYETAFRGAGWNEPEALTYLDIMIDMDTDALSPDDYLLKEPFSQWLANRVFRNLRRPVPFPEFEECFGTPDTGNGR